MSVVPNKKSSGKLTLLFIGAHPDDGEVVCMGTALQCIAQGNRVVFVSMTNGDAGHQTQKGAELASRRLKEANAAASHFGYEYIILDNHDGQLEASLENRWKLIRIIREIKPDLIITHRPNSYHPDHRNTSLLVQDSAYLYAVPSICPEVSALNYSPVIMYHFDQFTQPTPFKADVVVNISDVFEKKLEAMAFHQSQFFEWLPYIEGYLDEVPADTEGRLVLLREKWSNKRHINSLLKNAPDKENLEIEAFQLCEYGGALTRENIKQYFPFGISLL